jgi:hypothetical protein
VTPLRVWSSKEWLLAGREDAHVTLLTPFWGRTTLGSAGWPGYADELIEHGRAFLDLVELADADVAVYPSSARTVVRHGHERHAVDFAAAARAAGVPSVFFFEPTDTRGHLDAPFPVADAFVFRGSLFRPRLAPREFALPGFHEDLLEQVGGALPVRSKGAPVVSICGGVFQEHEPPRNTGERARRVHGHLRRFAWRNQNRHEEDQFVHARTLAALHEQRDVATSIVVRESGGGGNWTEFDGARWELARREFLDNMLDSDYVLCARGDGNWVLRFYEALCIGRIPVVVDTDLVMPYESLVPWRDYGVWIGRNDIAEIGRRVAAFHDALTPSAFEELQRELRSLWERYLSPLGFFRHFHTHFEHAGGS